MYTLADSVATASDSFVGTRILQYADVVQDIQEDLAWT